MASRTSSVPLFPKSRRQLVFVIALFGSLVGASDSLAQQPRSVPVDSLTIGRVVDQVLERDPSIEASLQNVDAAAARTKQARSQYWPRVEAVGTYRRRDPVSEFTVPGAAVSPGGAEGGRTVEIQPNNLYDGGLRVQQTIYDFGRRQSQVDQAKAGRVKAERQVATKRARRAFRAVQAFYTTLLAEAQIRVQRRQIEQFEKTLSVVRRRQDAGTATEFEVQSTLARLSEARSQLTRLQSQREGQAAELRRLLGRSRDDSLTLRGTIDSLAETSSLPNADALAATALQKHPAVRAAEAQVQAARREVEVADKSDAPTLALTAEAGVMNGFPDDPGAPRLNESVGVSLRVPLFEGFATRRRVEKSRAAAQAAEARLTDLRRQVETRVVQKTSELRASLDQLKATNTRLKQAQTAARLARTRYEAGTITNLEMLEAETELQHARLAQTEVQHAVVMARFELRRATGTLLPFEPLSP